MSARRDTSMIVLAFAFCIAAVAAQAQNIAADKQAPKPATKGQPPQTGAWKWSPTEKNAIKGQPQRESVAAKKVSPGTKQSLNPQPLPPREAGTMQR